MSLTPFEDKANKNDSSSVGEVHQMSSVGKFKGQVKVFVEENGETQMVWDDPNLIVDMGRKVLTHLLAEADQSFKVTEIRLGTMGHNLETNSLLEPIAPVPADIGLIDNTASVFSKPIGADFVYQGYNPDDSSVMFQIILEKTEANGETGTVAYTEAGLFTQNGSMFARETFPAIVKNANRRITFQWVISF